MAPPTVTETAHAPGPSPIEVLSTLLEEDMAAVDAIIHARMESPVALIPNLATHLIDAGGKRIRPLITLASARLLGRPGDAPRKLAAAVEFIHTATLLHDDVVDDSGLRRGRASANRLWGNPASVLVGDFLFARSFELMVETGDLDVLAILANAASIIAQGEVMQLAAESEAHASLERYLAIIEAKTAALFAAAARAGAYTAGKRGAEADALYAYGLNLGLAFQLVDDALDYDGRQAAMGKNTGDDFREGKITMPVVIAREDGSLEERDFWRRVMRRDQKDGDFAMAQALLHKHDAIARTHAEARVYVRKAQEALTKLPENVYRDALWDLADFVVVRGH